VDDFVTQLEAAVNAGHYWPAFGLLMGVAASLFVAQVVIGSTRRVLDKAGRMPREGRSFRG